MLSEVDLKLSKELSYALRHDPSAYFLILDDNGWCNLDCLLNSFNSKNAFGKVSVERIQSIVDDCDKKRFEIDEGNNRIRATYGHSIKDHPIVVSNPEQPPFVLYHGTSRDALDSIMTEGLKPMNRQYVHLSTDKETALKVGSRHDKNPVILVVFGFSAWLRNDTKFYHSTNDQTWMSEPIPPKYIRVLRPLTKEYVEEVEKSVVELEKVADAVDKKKETLLLLSLSSEERVKKILDIYESFPEGLWRKKKYPEIDMHARTLEKIRSGDNYDKLTGKLHLEWYGDTNRVFGYSFIHGIDDGYPESTSIKIPSEFLYIDEDSLKSRITEEVLDAMKTTIFNLECALKDAKLVLETTEYGMNFSLHD